MADVTLTIRDGQGYLSAVPSDERLQKALMAATSFRQVGYEHTILFQRKQWDGRTRLLRNQKFPPGLARRITDVFDKHDVTWEVANFDTGADNKPKLYVELTGIEERQYQLDAVERTVLLPRGIVRAPTGAGKTPIGARIIAARGLFSLIIVPTIDLLYQYKSFLEKHLQYSLFTASGDIAAPGRQKIGQLGDGVVDPQPITVSTLRTMAKVMNVAYEAYEFGEYYDKDDTEVNRRALREWVETLGVVIVDECHILGAKTVYETVTKIPAKAFFGMSASPWRDDGADLMIEGATGSPIYRIGTKELVDGGWLVPPVISVVDTREWWTPAAWGKVCKRCGQQVVTFKPECVCGSNDFKSQWTECYREEIVENPIRNDNIAKIVQGLDLSTLVLVKQVKHGRTLSSLIPDSVFLSGRDKSDDRRDGIKALKSGDARVLVATTIADMGLDIPNLGALVLAGGGKSSTRHLQRIGRVVRPYKEKRCGVVIDFDDGHVHTWFKNHQKARRKIEHAEWGDTAVWL